MSTTYRATAANEGGWNVEVDGEVVETLPTRSAARARIAELKLEAKPDPDTDDAPEGDQAPEGEVEPTMTPEAIAALFATNSLAVYNLGKAESAAKKAAKAAGEPMPPTPVLDWMNVDPAKRAKQVGAATGTSTATVKVSTDDVAAWIVAALAADPKAGAAKLLKQFRSEGRSCAQARFTGLVAEAKATA